MDTSYLRTQVTQKIIDWYKVHKRDLPWRNTNDPYKIWLSEIILQQTRVNQGIDYYLRFVEKFPTIDQLANADEELVLKLWQGLGYYSRARNLHATAIDIQAKYQSNFPKEYLEIKGLKGVGDYTAAAIASFAYNLPHACVDGNVYRVLSRIFEIDTPIDSNLGKKEFFLLANELLPVKNAAIYNQAMMEFGALQCTPKSPDCSACVINQMCLAYKNNSVTELPVKEKKTKQRTRFFYYFFVEDNNKQMLINKRIQKDIWQHLFEFPLLEFEKEQNINGLLKTKNLPFFYSDDNLQIINVSKQYKHILSHQLIYATFIHVKLKKLSQQNCEVIKLTKLKKFPVSRLVHMYMEDYGIIEKKPDVKVKV